MNSAVILLGITAPLLMISWRLGDIAKAVKARSEIERLGGGE